MCTKKFVKSVNFFHFLKKRAIKFFLLVLSFCFGVRGLRVGSDCTGGHRNMGHEQAHGVRSSTKNPRV